MTICDIMHDVSYSTAYSVAFKMKKFIQGKMMDYKFKKAGEGHKLNEEKSPTSLPKSQPGMFYGHPAIHREINITLSIITILLIIIHAPE